MLNRSRPPSDRFRFCRDLVSRSKSRFEVSRISFEGKNIVRTIDHFFFGTRFDWLRLLSRRLLADRQFLLSFFIYASFRFEDFSNTVIFTICFFVNVGKCWRKEIFSREKKMAERSERCRSVMQTGGDYGFGLVAPTQNATAVSLLPRVLWKSSRQRQQSRHSLSSFPFFLPNSSRGEEEEL